jgi:hypothetical protein
MGACINLHQLFKEDYALQRISSKRSGNDEDFYKEVVGTFSTTFSSLSDTQRPRKWD